MDRAPLTNDPVEVLLADLVEWIAKEERGYAEVMDAWRTSCPKLPVWEEANSRGLVTRAHSQGQGAIVRVTLKGRAFLDDRARMPAAQKSKEKESV